MADEKKVSVMTLWRRKNPERAAAYRKEYEAENRDELNRKRREYRKKNPDITGGPWYRQKYSLSLEEYQKLLDEQHSCCRLCGKPSWECRRRLVVDHDHKTGKVRGLLCTTCNILVGFIEKKGREAVDAAFEYVKHYSGQDN